MSLTKSIAILLRRKSANTDTDPRELGVSSPRLSRSGAGAAKRPERGKSPDTRRPPGSFHDGGEVAKTRVAKSREGQ
jgi:hypothetical protein